MAISFLHTSDWQIGKVFRYVDNATMGLLQEARLKAVTHLGEIAGQQDAHHVLVAGDIYEKEALSPRSLNQPLERMRNFPAVTWHLLPGNHDAYRPNSLWDQLLRKGVPDNVHIYCTPEPATLEVDNAILLPAPLYHRRTLQDPTAYMDDIELPEDSIRIGLAHGSITGFGSDDKDMPNYIAPSRPDSAGLSYLAMGDWHGQKEINQRCWYSGTPEIDAFNVVDGGKALLVEIEGRAAPPKVTPITTGHYNWVRLSEQVSDRAGVDFLAEKLRGLSGDLNRMLVDLAVEGALSLADRQYFEEQIVEGVSAALCFLRVDDRRLFPKPTEEDLDQIDRGGFVRKAADVLKSKAEEGEPGERQLAAEALQRLFIEHTKLQPGR